MQGELRDGVALIPPASLLSLALDRRDEFRREMRRTIARFHDCDAPRERARILQALFAPRWIVLYVPGQRSEPIRAALLHAVERVGGSITFIRKGAEVPREDNAILLNHHSRGERRGLWHYKAAYLPFMAHIDRRGYSGWSELHDETPERLAAIGAEEARAFFVALARHVIGGRITGSRQPAAAAPPEPGYVFVPLQVPGDTVLSLLFTAEGYLPAMEAAMRALLARGERVVAKPHPKGRTAEVMAMLGRLACGNLLVSDGSIHDLLPGCKAVLTANSSVGFEALLHEKPLLCLARADYRHAAHALREPADAPRALDAALAGHDPVRIHRLVHLALTRHQADIRSAEAMDRQVLRMLCVHGLDTLAARAQPGVTEEG
jgi:hypothetical protein